MKNMKIEINEQQPLEDVVKELERLGYKNDQFYFGIENHRDKDEFKSIACYVNGCFYYHKQCIDIIFYCAPTTLAELKEM